SRTGSSALSTSARPSKANRPLRQRLAAEARRWCRFAAGKRRKLAARAAPMAGLALGAAIFLPLGLGTSRDLPSDPSRRQPERLAARELDFGVEHELAGCDAPDRVPEAVHVGDPVLEQVAHALLPGLEQVARVGRLDVLRQEQNSRLRVTAADLLR